MSTIAMFKQFLKKRKQRKLQQQSRNFFESVYENINGAVLSKKDRGQIVKDDMTLVYGEIVWHSFLELLSLVNMHDGKTFVDFGSGTGKAVLATAINYPDAKCIGLETLPSLYNISLKCKNQFSGNYSVNNVEFLCQDFFDFDLSTTDVLFVNATGFFGESYSVLQKKLLQLPENAYLIITSKDLKMAEFTILKQDFYEMSWGLARVSIYQKNS